MTGTTELLAAGRVDLAIGPEELGIRGTPLMPVRMVPVAAPTHPLHALKRELTDRDLKRYRRILMRDTSAQRKPEVEGVELRWTVSNKATQIRALVMGLGFAWMPEETILPELRAGQLKALRLQSGTNRTAHLHVALDDPEFPGHDVARLVEILKERSKVACDRVKPARSGRARRS
jgi:DNA-binding transcriptional LysR family regulator